MRLIDADALKEKVENSPGEEGTILHYCKRVMVQCLNVDAPTVDAIPVEWMKKRWRETLPDGVEPDFDINYAFQEVMSEWHQEQVEQEGEA